MILRALMKSHQQPIVSMTVAGQICIMQPSMVFITLNWSMNSRNFPNFLIKGYDEMVESLIKNGSNVNVEDDDGSTPLDYAVWNGNQ